MLTEVAGRQFLFTTVAFRYMLDVLIQCASLLDAFRNMLPATTERSLTCYPSISSALEVLALFHAVAPVKLGTVMASHQTLTYQQWHEISLVCPETNEVVKLVVNDKEKERLEKDPEYARDVLQSHREVLPLVQNDEAEVHTEDGVEDLEGSVTDPIYRWSHEATLLLIHLFDENKLKMSSPKYTNNSVFAIIAEAIRSKGHYVSGKQCETKWTTLKRTDKKIKDHNGKSGNGAKSWLYFQEIDEILGRRPEMDPISTADSGGISSMSSSGPYSPNSSSSSSISACPSPTIVPGDLPPTKPEALPQSRKRKMSQQEMFDKMMNDRKAHHAERMKKQDHMLELLDKIVNKK